mgnify:CR=1 FL=1
MIINLKKVFLYFLVLCTIHFWGYNRIPDTMYRLMELILVLYFLYRTAFIFHHGGMRFKIPILIFILGTILNMLSAFFNHDQMIRDSFIQFFPYYFILFYFILHDQGFEREDMEKLILAMAILYAVIYIFQEQSYPNRFFNGAMYRDRGTLRLRIEGGGFIMLAYFLSLNRYLLNRRVIYLLLCGLFFYITLKGGFRSLTAAAIILSAILYIKLVNRSGFNYFLVIVAAIAFIGMLQWDPTARVIEGMISATEEQQAEQDRGETNIRILQFEYFTKEYPKNFSYYIVGGGLPGAFGYYSNYMLRLQGNGYYWVDLGLIGFYFVIGLVALVGLLFYAIKATFIRLPENSLYLNFYFAYLLLGSIFTMEIYRIGLFGVEAIALYLIDVSKSTTSNSETIQPEPAGKVVTSS